MKIHVYLLLLCSLFPVHCRAQKASDDASLTWAQGAVWYQIFPERFRNGWTGNDPIKERVVGDRAWEWHVHPWTADWYKMQDWEKARSDRFYDVVFDRRFGGDLVGVVQKLDYLKELGIDAIYFNPIFEAPSLHKYDATTYHHVDNNFGYNREGDWQAIQAEKDDPSTWSFTSADSVFLDLIAQAHKRNIKIVIDGVFNHCGDTFWAFRDVVEKQQKSRYRSWFDVTRWDDPATPDTNEFDYKSWWGFKAHPEFREDENGLVEPVKRYIFNITKRWMDPNGDGDPSDGIDGWRLDVIQDVAPAFWEEWYRLVKSINPDAITIGEIWDKAPDWIQHKRIDAVMNYPFAYAVVDFFIARKRQISVSEFDRRLRQLRETYPGSTDLILMNLVDSHDTDRIASMIKNPDRNYDRQAGLRDNPKYDPTAPTPREKRIQKLIATFQMTYVGAPAIYYGDEAGMWGGDDPDDRKPMLWPDLQYENETYRSVRPDLHQSDPVRFDAELFDYYKKLIGLRHAHPSLRFGDFRTRLVDDKRRVFAYSRTYRADKVFVVLNNSPEEQTVQVQTDWGEGQLVEKLSGQTLWVKDQQVGVSLPAYGAAILVQE